MTTTKRTEYLHVSLGWFLGGIAVLSRALTWQCTWFKKCRGNREVAKEGRRFGCVNFANHQSQQPLCIQCFNYVCNGPLTEGLWTFNLNYQKLLCLSLDLLCYIKIDIHFIYKRHNKFTYLIWWSYTCWALKY